LIVGVDARHLHGGRGVAHYTSALLGALAEHFPADRFRAFVPGAAGGRGIIPPPGVEVVGHRLPSRALFGPAAVLRRPRLDRLVGGADVLWIPAPAPVAISPGVPYVLTVHDISWLQRPGDFTAYERLWHGLGRLERLAQRARAVVVNAAATRDAIVERWGLAEERVHVIPPGVPPHPPAPAPAGLPADYVLAVGALEPRKAPEVLLAAWRRARERGLDAELVFAGQGRLADSLRGPGVHVLGAVPQLGGLYAGARALVMPSRLEGFGFPPLEAALAGTPSVVSDLPVFRETLGDDGAHFVPVDDVEALADALLAIDPAVAVRARAAAERFTWEQAADRLHAVLEAAAR
jgi:glycosyltransferase involved in cell wall biosynthesis